jgi:hypothetical protein
VIVFLNQTNVDREACISTNHWTLLLDVLTTSTVSLVSGCRYFSPFTAEDLSRTDAAISTLLSNDGLDIKHFRRLAFLQLIPRLDEFNDRDLIVSKNGHVAAMAALWK